MKKCWDMKEECPFRDTDPAESKCPAHASQTPCWEFDWLSFYAAMPSGFEKDGWKRMMLDWCPKCEVRDTFTREVDTFVAALREL